MIVISRIIIKNCHISVSSRELLDEFRRALKRKTSASDVLFDFVKVPDDTTVAADLSEPDALANSNTSANE